MIYFRYKLYTVIEQGPKLFFYFKKYLYLVSTNSLNTLSFTQVIQAHLCQCFNTEQQAALINHEIRCMMRE